ncbi:GNAT family N-acetyltransferase [Streptomyces sp. NPDC001815]|uniref:GNAT family N-acetyltransferase n=1 Tax=Streptomyces sp. NPDC001815 TaxID=3154526 RepID=UPI003326C5CF
MRPFTEADVDLLVALDSDPDVMRFINGGRPTSRDAIEARTLPGLLHIHPCISAPGFWAAQEKATGTFLGWFELGPLDDHRIHAAAGCTSRSSGRHQGRLLGRAHDRARDRNRPRARFRARDRAHERTRLRARLRARFRTHGSSCDRARSRCTRFTTVCNVPALLTPPSAVPARPVAGLGRHRRLPALQRTRLPIPPRELQHWLRQHPHPSISP